MARISRIMGQLLIDDAGVKPSDVEAALSSVRKPGERLGDTLIRMGVTTPDAVARSLACQLGLDFAPGPLEPTRAALNAILPALVRTHSVVPIEVDGRRIRIALSDPLNVRAIDDVQFQTGCRVECMVATPAAVAAAVETWFTADPEQAGPGAGPASALAFETSDPTLGDLVRALPPSLTEEVGRSDDAAELERETNRKPVVRLVDGLIRKAIEKGASDIHVEETGDEVRVRVRIDGRLEQTIDLPGASRRAVLSRLKVIAGMDISVRRRAQDGRIPFVHRGRKLTLRVSTLPVNGGEKAVVRILDSDSAPRGLGDLGLSTTDLTQLRTMLQRGEGVLLSAGPTGSGKSTTLFAALSDIDRDINNVVTLEDPVEYRLPGASQIQVDRRAGLGFPEALRAVLRQDPDVVMIGEIRDRETAEIAMSAAVTGHLVLSTIHTTDAPSAITRLLHMGVPPFLVAGGLAGVVAQRLVRRTCPICRGRACEECGDGTAGRTGIYQVLTVSDEMRDEISAGGSASRLRQLARESGTKTLESDARRAIAAGLTLPHEVSSLLLAEASTGLPCSHCDIRVPFGATGCPGCGRRREHSCACGRPLAPGWRYCPWCIRPAGDRLSRR
jgi:type IV pilus assembly protein PilB